MKNFIYISLLLLGVFVSSCSKEEVVNNANTEMAPTWNSAPTVKSISAPVSNNDQPVGEGSIPTFGGSQPVGDSAPGEITDPNNDPDGKKKKN